MKKPKEYHFNIELNGKEYTISLSEKKSVKMYNNSTVYACVVFNKTDTITYDRFDLIRNWKDNVFWAWTGDIVTRIDKREFRENIASLFTAEKLKLSA